MTMRTVLAIVITAAGLGAVQTSPKFNSSRAYEDLRQMVEIGPRPAGSPELEKTREYIRRELKAAGLDVLVARKRFYPQGALNAGVGYEAFNPRYMFITPEALAAQVVGNMVLPFINRKAIKADYFTANARQLQAIYNFQRVVLNAFTEVINRMAKVENYTKSIEIKKQQVEALAASVVAATSLYQFPRAGVDIDYLDVLLAQDALFEARRELIETKQQQLSAIVNVYQALGGGLLGCSHADPRHPQPGPSLDQSQQGGSDPSGAEQLPLPRKQPEEFPAPGKQPEQPPAPGKKPEQLSVPNPAQPGRLPEPSKLPTYILPPIATRE